MTVSLVKPAGALRFAYGSAPRPRRPPFPTVRQITSRLLQLNRLTALASTQPDHQVAERLNAEGPRTRTGKKWTYARVNSIRKQHAIPTGCPLVPRPAAKRADGLVSSKVAAECLQVSPSLVNLWVKHGVLRHDQRVAASKVWVHLSEADFARLTGASPEAANLPTLKSVRPKFSLSGQTNR